MPLLPKKSLINSKAGTCLHPKLIMDSEGESRRVPHMLPFLTLVLNAQKVNHSLMPALDHVHPAVQDYKTNTSVTSTKRTCVYTG